MTKPHHSLSHFGEQETEYGTVEVSNNDLYPFVRVINALADETRLTVDDEGFHTRVVDPANVCMVDVTLQITTELDTFTTAAPIERLYKLLQNKPRDAEVELTFAEPNGTIRIQKESRLGNAWDVSERVSFLESGMVRDTPDPIEEEGTDTSVTVDVYEMHQHFQSRVKESKSQAVEFSVVDGKFQIGLIGEEADFDSIATVDVAVDGDSTAVFSLDYLKSVFKALNSLSGVEDVTMRWGQQYPMFIEFEQESLAGEYALAPRIRSE
jgi:proliferating cell nuclear antigen